MDIQSIRMGVNAFVENKDGVYQTNHLAFGNGDAVNLDILQRKARKAAMPPVAPAESFEARLRQQFRFGAHFVPDFGVLGKSVRDGGDMVAH